MSTVPHAELAFYRSERPRLIADGVTDYNAQCAELKRRWGVMQALKAAAPPHAPVLAVVRRPSTRHSAHPPGREERLKWLSWMGLSR